jgi:hypothetical protein
MTRLASLLSFAALATSLAACGKKQNPEPTPAVTSPVAPVAAPTTPAAPTPVVPAAKAPAPSAVAEGAACTGGTRRVTDTPISIAGDQATFTRDRGGGCPTRPVYTLIFTKANPTEIRICEDVEADKCEMFIKAEKVSFDLKPVFAASGANSAVLGK